MTHFVSEYGLWVVFLVVFVEVAGLPFIPGETALIAAAAAAGNGKGNIVAIIGLATAAAILGALVSYIAGKRWGTELLNRSAWLERHTHRMVDRGQEFFRKHGAKSVFIGRFVPVVRALLGWMAGIGEMSFARFMVWNVLGAVAWACGIGVLAYYVGSAVIAAIEHDLLYGVLAILGVVAVVAGVKWLERRGAH